MIKNKFKEQFVGKDPFTEIIKKNITKEQIKSALLMDRHVLIIGPPGVGKTTIAKNVALLLPEIEVNDCPYNCDPKEPLCPTCLAKKPKTKKIKGTARLVRLQGSPDLTVEDIIGDIDPIKALKFGPTSLEAFTPGKIFKANNGILFFDEVNRCPEKLQNALLQVLQEGRATIGSYTVDLPANFIFIGTMNPEETAATEDNHTRPEAARGMASGQSEIHCRTSGHHAIFGSAVAPRGGYPAARRRSRRQRSDSLPMERCRGMAQFTAAR